jgi:polyhydroxyalkanoate synthesis regulator phasin
MPDAWRAYLEMALGLTEAPRKRAQKVVGELANRGGATATQMQGLVEDLMSAGVANREALTNIVRHEVDRALGVVGLATVQEVDELNTRVRDLERQLRDERAKVASDEETGFGGTRLDEPAPLPRKVAKKAVTTTPNAMPSAGRTSAPAKKAAKPVAKTAAPPAKKTAAKKAVAKKAPGTAEAPTAGVREAAAGTVLPPAAGTPQVDDVGRVDSEEAGFVDRGEAGLTPAKKAAKKTAAKKAAPGSPEASA